MKYKIIRELEKKEQLCDMELKKGDIVYRYEKCTYGCISDYGTACSLEIDTDPFFEVPNNALEIA